MRVTGTAPANKVSNGAAVLSNPCPMAAAASNQVVGGFGNAGPNFPAQGIYLRRFIVVSVAAAGARIRLTFNWTGQAGGAHTVPVLDLDLTQAIDESFDLGDLYFSGGPAKAFNNQGASISIDNPGAVAVPAAASILLTWFDPLLTPQA